MLRILASIVVLLASAGCSTVVVNRAQGVAETGKVFVQTMGKVNELALDRSLDFAANFLTTSVSRTDSDLASQTTLFQARSKLIGEYKTYLQGLADYFGELESLSKGDQSDSTANALGTFADALKAEPIALKLSDERKKALTGLAGLVAKQFHAAAVEKALIRDADTIAQAIAVSEKMLEEQKRWITFRERATRELNYAQKVKAPFISGQTLSEDWKKEWTTYVRTPPTTLLLEEAEAATANMQKAWRGVLRADYSFAEIQASLLNVKAGIDALSALKEFK
jgi:hypothetical protein